MRSEDFRTRWASHDVRQYRSGTQPFRHPLVGDLTLNYEALELAADVGLILIVYTAERDAAGTGSEAPEPDVIGHGPSG